MLEWVCYVWLVAAVVVSAEEEIDDSASCDFEKPCGWMWNTTAGFDNFVVVNATTLRENNISYRGPPFDGDHNVNGESHFFDRSLST